MYKKVLIHQDNALVHKSIKTTAKLLELSYELLPHPPIIKDSLYMHDYLISNGLIQLRIDITAEVVKNSL
jgi:hypothetical protein